jgi:hypothetical protein
MGLPVMSMIAWGRVFLLSCLVMLLHQGTGFCGEKAEPVKDYYALVKQLKSGDTSIDYARLRFSFTKTKDYNPYSPDDADRNAMFEALNGENFDDAVKHAQAVLGKNYVDLDAHFISRIGYRELKNTEKFNFHSTVLKGLMDSIYESGDGQAPESAFIVISTSEEYFLLRMNGFRSIAQKGLEREGLKFDELEAEKIKSGEKRKFYFNIDFPFRWLKSQMDTKPQ